ncbi:rod shape-determining protein MreD [Jannaschia seohaensis]|uniref:Rod shape-determining protein MreD n=1 Tax=Jannaschia seohaensis TaxID=475081 RepID=A0A2Y9B0A7_9RHOB|nr:rod shape-determining protein MreD [Jannaschia seohaensis]PWJ16999.1 rod shape-determining protein MreD [Jannaschia seohaensis]SSA48317.1 rod shape-determining protein MreD [Jannaschia seohaensis]
MGPSAIWGYRLAFFGLSSAILFFALLPFGPPEDGVPGPDLLVCLAFAWILRRPDYVPVWLLVPILLLADALLMRPLGLWTLVTLLGSEYLRRRVDHTEVKTFWSEVAAVAAVIAGMFVINHLAMLLLLAQTAPLLDQGLHLLATVVFYPLTAIFSQLIGVRRLAPGELDTLGTRA